MEIKTYFYFNANNNKHLKMCEFQLKLCLKEICKHTNKGIKIEKEWSQKLEDFTEHINFMRKGN